MTLRELYIHLDEYHFEPHCKSCGDLLNELCHDKKGADGSIRTWECRNCMMPHSASDLIEMIDE